MSKGLSKVFDRITDALDVETFLVCESEDEAKQLALQMMKDLGFNDTDVVFVEFMGPGARVRVRAYVCRSGDAYSWLDPEKEEEAN